MPPPSVSKRTSIRARPEAREALVRLSLELAVTLGRPVPLGEALRLATEYAEGDTAGFLDWAAAQERVASRQQP